MKITGVRVFRRELLYVGGTYVWGSGNVVDTADSTVVVIDTDAGISGCGEVCPVGSNYLAAYAEGVRAAMPLLAGAIVGEDPRCIARIELIMDTTLRGHGYAKTPIDAACWDLLGKATGQPVWMLLGGRLTPKMAMYRVAPQKDNAATVAEMDAIRSQGYRQFQIKVGADWVADIDRIRATVPLLQAGETAYVDANTGWTVDQAIRVARATADLDYHLEQPCLTYDECLHVRSRTTLPMKLDECMTSLFAVERAVHDRACEVVCVKISNQGGLSKARRVRDYLTTHRMPMLVEDTWGGEIVTATLAHLATSTPPDLLRATTDLQNYVVGSTGNGGATVDDGHLIAPDGPGLGVEPAWDELGDPVAEYTL